MARSALFKEIEELTDTIVSIYKPEKIILFGSYAYGRPHADSDVDMLVIMPVRGKAACKAAEILEKINPAIPVDLLVRSSAQIRKRLALNDFFLREVMTKGRILYEATD